MFEVMTKNNFRNLFEDVFSKRNELVTDIKEKDGKYEMSCNLAGFNKDDIQVKLDRGNLIISATKKEEEETEYMKKESMSSVSRSFYVGGEYKDEDFNVVFDNGVLSIVFDKKEPKEIEVKSIKVK